DIEGFHRANDSNLVVLVVGSESKSNSLSTDMSAICVSPQVNQRLWVIRVKKAVLLFGGNAGQNTVRVGYRDRLGDLLGQGLAELCANRKVGTQLLRCFFADLGARISRSLPESRFCQTKAVCGPCYCFAALIAHEGLLDLL